VNIQFGISSITAICYNVEFVYWVLLSQKLIFFFHTVRDIDEWQLVVIMHFNCVLQT